MTSTPTFTLRKAFPADAQAMVQVHYHAVHSIASADYAPELLQSWSPAPSEARYAWMRERIASVELLVLVAESQGEVVGFGMAGIAEGYIYALYVDPRAKGLGCGGGLLTALEDCLAALGVQTLTLKASANALSFYQSLSYQLVQAATQMLADGTEMPCFEMTKPL